MSDTINKTPKKFGTFNGVFIPSTEAILGTVLFLLLPTLTGDVGLIPMLLIIFLGHSVTLSTSFSLSDCATNLNSIGSGGMYALSRKSLGKAFGGSIGIQLYFAQAFSIGFYCIGFVEPLQPLLQPLLSNIPLISELSPQLQKQILASIVFIIFFIIVLIGADFTLKLQLIILFILFFSILSIFISPLLKSVYNGEVIFSENFGEINIFGNRAITLSVFFMAFTQFFPAVTGIDAGVGMSGDLKNPKKSLVFGTFTSIFITMFVYIISTLIFSMIKKDLLVTEYISGNPKGIILTELLGFSKPFPYNIPGFMILLGILFATSSSALSCFMTSPRTLQSLCRDGILPKFLFFLKNDFKKNGNEPRFATIVSFVFGISIIWIGNINVAAMIVGICFLIVYVWVNVSAFFERISKNPTFRPTTKGHWAISLYGFLAALFAIALFSWKIGIAVFISQYIVFRLILKYKSENKLEGVWWGVLFAFITKSLKSLKKIVQGSKNWRPILTSISFGGAKNYPKKIAYFSEQIAAYQGLVNMNIISSETENGVEVDKLNFDIPIKLIKVTNPTEAVLSLIQASYPSGIEPNSVLLEYSKKIDTVKIINKTLSLEKNVLLLKNAEKFEKHEKIDIWWRGERNGNLMVLLAYIINSSVEQQKRKDYRIRVIRKLDLNENIDDVEIEIKEILDKARLNGEVVVLSSESNSSFIDTLTEVSKDSDLLILGLPGNIKSDGLTKLFNLNEIFFAQEIEKYNHLPTILFVKCFSIFNLIEE